MLHLGLMRMEFAMQGLLSALRVPLGQYHRLKVDARNIWTSFVILLICTYVLIVHCLLCMLGLVGQALIG